MLLHNFSANCCAVDSKDNREGRCRRRPIDSLFYKTGVYDEIIEQIDYIKENDNDYKEKKIEEIE